MPYAGGCREYAIAWGVDPDALQHCGSCHDDAEELGMEMCTGRGPDDREYDICCTLGDAVAAAIPKPNPSESPNSSPDPARFSEPSQ